MAGTAGPLKTDSSLALRSKKNSGRMKEHSYCLDAPPLAASKVIMRKKHKPTTVVIICRHRESRFQKSSTGRCLRKL